MVVEKILGDTKSCPLSKASTAPPAMKWMNAITQVLIDGEGLEPLDDPGCTTTSRQLDPVLKAAKRRVLEGLLTSEFTVLSRLLARIASGHYRRAIIPPTACGRRLSSTCCISRSIAPI